jgi:hypothetical protein
MLFISKLPSMKRLSSAEVFYIYHETDCFSKATQRLIRVEFCFGAHGVSVLSYIAS